MNKLLFHEGGQPLHLDDLEFMQESLINSFKVIHHNVGNCILWGAEVDRHGFVTCNPGAILYNGRVYEIPERIAIDHLRGDGTFDYEEEHLYWEFWEQEQGHKTFENGTEKATQLRCQARLVASLTPLSLVPFKSIPRLGHRSTLSKPLAEINVTSEYLSLVDCSVLSRHSAVLTLKVLRDAAFDDILGNIEIEVNWIPSFEVGPATNISGEIVLPRSFTKKTGAVILEVQAGKLYYRKGDGVAEEAEKTSFSGVRTITLFVNWDYTHYLVEDLLEEF